MSVTFLSDEWIAALDDAASASGTHPGAPDPPLVIQQEVTGRPAGPITYHLVIGRTETRVRRGPAPAATVRISQDVATASAIAHGSTSAQRAFMTGQLRVGGDLAALLHHAESLAELDDLFAEVRHRTVADA